MKDANGSTISVGDWVFITECVDIPMIRGQISSLDDGKVWVHIKGEDIERVRRPKCVIKDDTQELDYLHSRDLRLSQIEALGLDEGEIANDGWEVEK